MNDDFSYFISMNPHKDNTSSIKLLSNFKHSLIKYYKWALGKHFNQYKDKQFEYLMVKQLGNNYTLTNRRPHLHLLVKYNPHLSINEFHDFITNKMKSYYPDLTSNLQAIYDLKGVYDYSDRIEDRSQTMPVIFYTNQDFQQKDIK